MDTTTQRTPADDLTDEALHDRLLAGDDDLAATAIYDRFHRSVRTACVSVLIDRELAEDVTQDVFIEFIRRPGGFDARRGSMRGYLSMMARRRSIDLVRTISSSRRRELASLTSRHSMRTTADPADQVAAAAEIGSVRAALRRLPESQRRVIGLAFYADNSYRQVASILEIPEGTAKSQIRSALARLRRDPELLSSPAPTELR